jgi:hypothetical protein
VTTTAGYSRSGRTGTLDAPAPAYNAWLARAKVTGRAGPGSILAWIDLAQRTDEGVAGAPDATTDFAYAWLNYNWTIHTGDRGSFVIGPAWRILNTSREGTTLRRRHKIEINFDATFR